jgi:hypothetical protein|tara:strand:+ start:484 stop:924 length:441 start_codon:yes stop_codon:yes gene_type:complete
MATLTGTQIRNTYDALLKLEDNDGVTGSKKQIQDGLGTATPLSISTTEVTSTVDLEATGFKTPTGTSSEFLMADGSVSSVSGDKHYTHNQTSSLATWPITHNLGKFPSVTVVDSANTVVVGEIEMININEIEITFSAGFSGKAYLN